MSSDAMKITFVCNGKPERIPNIGEKLPIKPHAFFVVEEYGDSREIGPFYEIDLLGHIVIPAGSPMRVLEDMLNGRLFDDIEKRIK